MKRFKILVTLIMALLLVSCGQKNDQSWTLVGPDDTEIAGIKIADFNQLEKNQVTVAEKTDTPLNARAYVVKSNLKLVPTRNDSLPLLASVQNNDTSGARLGGRFTVNFISPGDSISVYEAMLMAGHETEMILHALGWYIIKIDQGPYPHGASGWKFWTKDGSSPWQEVPCSTFDYLAYWGWQIAWRYGS